MTLSDTIPSSGRGLRGVMGLHNLTPEIFDGAVVYDLGCGRSDLGADLARMGIQAAVKGFDSNPGVINGDYLAPGRTERVLAPLGDRLPVPDQSADIVLATFSMPMYGQSVPEIHRFYDECERVVKVRGLLAICPITSSTRTYGGGISPETERLERLIATQTRADRINTSSNWRNLSQHPLFLKAIKVR